MFAETNWYKFVPMLHLGLSCWKWKAQNLPYVMQKLIVGLKTIKNDSLSTIWKV